MRSDNLANRVSVDQAHVENERDKVLLEDNGLQPEVQRHQEPRRSGREEPSQWKVV